MKELIWVFNMNIGQSFFLNIGCMFILFIIFLKMTSSNGFFEKRLGIDMYVDIGEYSIRSTNYHIIWFLMGGFLFGMLPLPFLYL